jgi:hypothetical protein
VRYRGIAKNLAQMHTLFGQRFANLRDAGNSPISIASDIV